MPDPLTEPPRPSVRATDVKDSYPRLFRRFLRFGCLAWGGPVAQIDMIRHELVAQERWVSADYFRRLLAIYQVLPGPEAHELCVHFGMLARGRWGGVLAGLGFMLPGFGLMLLLSWLYLRAGLADGWFHAVFLGVQPAVIALIVRACHRLSQHCLTDRWLALIAAIAAVADFAGVSFLITLSAAGAAYVAALRRRWLLLGALAVVIAAVAAVPRLSEAQNPTPTAVAAGTPSAPPQSPPATALTLLGSGLRTGLLTFGGAYTAIPFLKHDAVEQGRWMTERDFLDGLALSGILPAPLIIFSTFVGYFGGGLVGALAITLGVFLPAFAFPLLFHRHLDALLHNAPLRQFLEGVTAGVVGIIVTTTVRLAFGAITNAPSIVLCLAALGALYLWKSKFAVPLVMLAAGAAGAWVFAGATPG